MKNEEFRVKNAQRVRLFHSSFFLVVLAVMLAVPTAANAQNQVFRYSVTPGASVSVVSDYGPITVRAVSANQVVVTANAHSSQVQVDSNQNGNRIDVRSRYLGKAAPDQERVDYDLQVPVNAMVTIHTATGPVKVQNLGGDLSVDADTGAIEVQDVAGGHVHLRTVSGPITLTNVRDAHVELRSVGGELKLTNVSGPQVSANTTAGVIHYSGDFSGGGVYALTSHSGDVEVSVPGSCSADISADSVNGSVENGLTLQPDAHPAKPLVQGKSFSGRANGGAASVRLRTFSGKIRVTKQ